MRLIKCRKCGTTVTTDDTLLESLMGQMQDLNNKSIKSKGARKNSYDQQASQIKKLITQIQHRETTLKDRGDERGNLLGILVSYVLEEKLITEEKLQELTEDARSLTKKKILQEEQAIKQLYGEAENWTTNRTKRDNTAKAALENT